MNRQAVSVKIHNFENMLPAVQTMKDPYLFDCVEYKEGMIERDVEDELVANITKFLLEMGSGFAFMGRQKLLKVDDQEFSQICYSTIQFCTAML